MKKKYYYSASTGGFYNDEVNGPDKPADCVEISKDEWIYLLNGQTEGKIIVPDESGRPTLVTPPAPTPEDDAKRPASITNGDLAELVSSLQKMQGEIDALKTSSD